MLHRLHDESAKPSHAVLASSWALALSLPVEQAREVLECSGLCSNGVSTVPAMVLSQLLEASRGIAGSNHADLRDELKLNDSLALALSLAECGKTADAYDAES